MPITMTALTSSWSATDASSYATASITPSANKLILVAVVDWLTAGPSTAPTLSGNGLTWVQVATRTEGPMRLTLFRSMGASPTSGAITIDYAAQTIEVCIWSVVEFGDVDTTGTNGAGAVVQSATNVSSGATSLTVTLGAFSDVNNATYGALTQRGSNVLTQGTGFTEIYETVSNDPVRNYNLETEWRSDNDTTVDASASFSQVWAGIAVEIKAAAVAAGVTGVIFC